MTCLTQAELEAYLATGTLPPEERLLARFERSALVFTDGHATLLLGDAVDHLERELITLDEDIVRGMCAVPGVAVGRCRIVRDPSSPGDFDEGDILVTGMTRPEFYPLVAKACAIVTDVGGRLCHAAITALELGKPCVVGTGNATLLLKDAKLIRVDASAGTVSIISE